MIETLQKLIPQIIPYLNKPKHWDSLIINRRQPITYRVHRQFDDIRVCLHKFEPCHQDESFPHPHPWPGAFLMLEGEYIHTIGYSQDLQSDPTFIYREIIRPYTTYEITNRQLWHTVQPTKTTHTIMCNGPAWENQHKQTRTTKGKDLDTLPPNELKEHLQYFQQLLVEYTLSSNNH